MGSISDFVSPEMIVMEVVTWNVLNTTFSSTFTGWPRYPEDIYRRKLSP